MVAVNKLSSSTPSNPLFVKGYNIFKIKILQLEQRQKENIKIKLIGKVH